MGGVSVGGVVAVVEVRSLDESIAEELLMPEAVRGTVGNCENIGEFVAFAKAAERARWSAVMPSAFRGIARGSGGSESFEAGIGGRGEN